MRTKDELLADLDTLEKQLGNLISETFTDDSAVEPLPLQQARIRYGEGGLWLRHWIEKLPA